MTKSQERAIARIKRMCEDTLFFGGPDEYEFKRWDIDENEYFVSLFFETGMKGDEGTLAVLCRNRAHLFIYPRGRVMYPMHHTCKNGKHKHWTRQFKWGSILTPVLDQRIR